MHGDTVQVVAESPGDRPDAETPPEIPVHQHARAGFGRAVEHRFQIGVRRDLAREVVIEIPYAHSALEKPQQGRPVALHGYVENGDAVAGAGVHAPKQRDVPFRAGDEQRVCRLCEAKLAEGAKSVRVAVEDVDGAHQPAPESRTAIPSIAWSSRA
jgi:hypothetical protein